MEQSVPGIQDLKGEADFAKVDITQPNAPPTTVVTEIPPSGTPVPPEISAADSNGNDIIPWIDPTALIVGSEVQVITLNGPSITPQRNETEMVEIVARSVEAPIVDPAVSEGKLESDPGSGPVPVPGPGPVPGSDSGIPEKLTDEDLHAVREILDDLLADSVSWGVESPVVISDLIVQDKGEYKILLKSRKIMEESESDYYAKIEKKMSRLEKRKWRRRKNKARKLILTGEKKRQKEEKRIEKEKQKAAKKEAKKK